MVCGTMETKTFSFGCWLSRSECMVVENFRLSFPFVLRYEYDPVFSFYEVLCQILYASSECEAKFVFEDMVICLMLGRCGIYVV
jgi:hypothetical protein